MFFYTAIVVQVDKDVVVQVDTNVVVQVDTNVVVQVDTNVAPGPVHHGWKVREQIDSKAVWISSQKSDIPADTTVYCRLKLGQI